MERFFIAMTLVAVALSASSDATLSSLALSNGFTLSPTFSSATTAYSITVTAKTTLVTMYR